jgi:hypothetical protein
MKKIPVIGGMLHGESSPDRGPGKWRLLWTHDFIREGSDYSLRTLHIGGREVRAFVVDGMSDEAACDSLSRAGL